MQPCLLASFGQNHNILLVIGSEDQQFGYYQIVVSLNIYFYSCYCQCCRIFRLY